MTVDAVLATVLFVVAGCGLVAVVGSRSGTLSPALVAFVIRLLAGNGFYVALGLFAPDAIYYDATATSMLEGDSVIVTAGKEGWPQLLAFIYGLLGHHPHLGLIVNAVAGALTASMVGIAAARIGAPRMTAAWLAALMPSGVLWSSLLLRESITWLLLVTAAVGFTDAGKRHHTWRAVIVIATSLTLLLAFRGTLAILVACSGIIAVAFMRRQTIRWALAAAISVPLLIIFTPLGTQIDRVLGSLSLQSINNSREILSEGAATGWPVVEVTDAASLVESLWIAVPRLLLGPYPWEWGVVGLVLAADAIVWIVVLILAIRGWATLPRRSATVFIFVAGAVLAALITTSGNYGTAQRLRVQTEVLLLPLAAAGLLRDRQTAQLAWRNEHTGIEESGTRTHLYKMRTIK